MLRLNFSENKGLWFDIKFSKWDHSWFSFDVSWSRKTDHAGFKLWASIRTLNLELEITDRRHWNYEKDCWFGYGEDMKDNTLIEDEVE